MNEQEMKYQQAKERVTALRGFYSKGVVRLCETFTWFEDLAHNALFDEPEIFWRDTCRYRQ